MANVVGVSLEKVSNVDTINLLLSKESQVSLKQATEHYWSNFNRYVQQTVGAFPLLLQQQQHTQK